VNDGLATASLVLGFTGFTVLPFLGSLLAVIFGHRSRGAAKRAGRRTSGLATAGVWLGWIGLAGSTVMAIVIAVAITSAGNGTVSTAAPAASPPAAAAPETPAPAPSPDMLAMGSAGSVTTGGIPSASITISGPVITTQPADPNGSAPQNGYFVTVTATMTADSSYSDGFSINAYDFYALSPGGGHYTEDNGHALYALSGSGQELSSSMLAASESTSGKLVFDVPSAHGQIVYAPNSDGQPLAEWSY
jgi:hypothetical protein